MSTGLFAGTESTGVVPRYVANGSQESREARESTEKKNADGDLADLDAESLPPSYDNTHRRLKARHIQLIGIGGTIGTALFVQIGKSLIKVGKSCAAAYCSS